MKHLRDFLARVRDPAPAGWEPGFAGFAGALGAGVPEEHDRAGGDLPAKPAELPEVPAPRDRGAPGATGETGETPGPAPATWRDDLATWDAAWQELWEERAAIMEHDGGLNRDDAQGEAYRRIAPSIWATG
jgi:hypothetical protein